MRSVITEGFAIIICFLRYLSYLNFVDNKMYNIQTEKGMALIILQFRKDLVQLLMKSAFSTSLSIRGLNTMNRVVISTEELLCNLNAQ